MANILGVQAFSFNQAASLCKDGKLVAFIEDEKVSRIKSEKGNFPISSVDYCLKEGKVKVDDIDEVAVAWKPHILFFTALKFALLGFLRAPFQGGGFNKSGGDPVSLFYDRFIVLIRHCPFFMKNLIRFFLRFSNGGKKLPRVKFVSHHLSHAAGTYYLSGFNEAAIVVADGMGDSESTTLWHGKGLDIKLLKKIQFPNSLGEYYAAFTQFLGFKPYNHEGKLMGLAAYGQNDPILAEKMRKILCITEADYVLDSSFTVGGRHTFGTYYSDKLVAVFGSPRHKDEEFSAFHKNLAFVVQDFLEKAMCTLVRDAIRRTGCSNVCLAGGVAMNCKMNGAVLAMKEVEQLFVLPASDDSGAALGASLLRSVAHGHDPRFQLQHAYYGPGYGDKEIKEDLDRFHLRYREVDLDNVEIVVNDLIEGDVIGLYTGRMEFGARALGARSIIANPAFPGIKDRVNEKVKFREGWRPFAPVVLKGTEADLFEDGEISRFMMKAFRAKPKTKEMAPEIIHVDGTVRPQTAEKETNPLYTAILECFYKKTGVPILLNTSFNLRGEPIVATPSNAIRTFFSSGMDHLLIGRYYLSKF